MRHQGILLLAPRARLDSLTGQTVLENIVDGRKLIDGRLQGLRTDGPELVHVRMPHTRPVEQLVVEERWGHSTVERKLRFQRT